jgi:hypothetical protein
VEEGREFFIDSFILVDFGRMGSRAGGRDGSLLAFFTPVRRDDDDDGGDETERKRVKMTTTSPPPPSSSDVDVVARCDSGSRFERCPVCLKDVHRALLSTHAVSCDGAIETMSPARVSLSKADDAVVKDVVQTQQQQQQRTGNAFASMMAAQRERERCRIFSLSFDDETGRWSCGLTKTSPIGDATWSSQVAVKEKLSSGMPCTTTLKLVTNISSESSGPKKEHSIRAAVASARELAEVRQGRVGEREELKVSVIKSALQKNIRRGRAVAASRVATHMCLSQDSFVECVRRLVIISLEDGILHPEITILAWLMCATSKGFQPFDSLRACVARIAGEMAAVNVKDKISYGAAKSHAQQSTLLLGDIEAELPPEESALVQSIVIRAHFGGMSGDVAMLQGFARIWLERFKQGDASDALDVPREYDFLRNPEVIDCSVNKSPWLNYLELITEEARERDEADATKWGGVMRREDIPIAAVDFHVSACVENVLQVPTIRLKIVDVGKEFGIQDMDVTDRVKSAIWRHSAGVNYRKPIVLRGSEEGPTEAKKSAKENLSERIWAIIKHDLELWVKRYLAFRMPR